MEIPGIVIDIASDYVIFYFAWILKGPRPKSLLVFGPEGFFYL